MGKRQARGKRAAAPDAGRFPLLLFSFLFSLTLLLGADPATPPAAALPDRPPLAHTGGFGEPTCRECHFDNPLNDAGGRLTLSGAPERFELERTYYLTVHLSRSGLGAGGFELAARWADGPGSGGQAGRLFSLDERVDVADTVLADHGSVAYARHTRAGARAAGEDTLGWVVQWKAPASGAGAVVFHVAANAANDDDSPLSDYIYTATARATP